MRASRRDVIADAIEHRKPARAVELDPGELDAPPARALSPRDAFVARVVEIAAAQYDAETAATAVRLTDSVAAALAGSSEISVRTIATSPTTVPDPHDEPESGK